MPTKRVLDVGNCGPDHAAIRRLIEGEFEAEVAQTHGPEDTLRVLRADAFDLVLVNRILDRDGGDGMEIIRQIKDDQNLRGTPCMLMSNFSTHQDRAVASGAVRGFGKAELRDAETIERLRPFLR